MENNGILNIENLMNVIVCKKCMLGNEIKWSNSIDAKASKLNISKQKGNESFVKLQRLSTYTEVRDIEARLVKISS